MIAVMPGGDELIGVPRRQLEGLVDYSDCRLDEYGCAEHDICFRPGPDEICPHQELKVRLGMIE